LSYLFDGLSHPCLQLSLRRLIVKIISEMEAHKQSCYVTVA
jgi:hypothetical protein